MFSTLRTRFGIPGVISVMALVFAMFGGAYAASNSSDGGKATASAKAKKGPRGPKGAKGDTGPAGPAGPQGAAGASGRDGANGEDGEDGKDGDDGQDGEDGNDGADGAPGATGPTGATGPAGPEGKPWTHLGVLPPGETETGAWSFGEAPKTGTLYVPISFPIPLPAALGESAVHYLGLGASPTTDCPGTVSDPKAAPGHLCLYTGEEVGTYSALYIANPDPVLEIGASKAGAVLTVVSASEGTRAFGSWAVTAPAAGP